MTQAQAAARHPLLSIGQVGDRVLRSGPASVSGLPATARALLVLDTAARAGVPVAVIAASDSAAAGLASDLRGLARLTGALHPESIDILPPLDADPWDGIAAHQGSVCRRMRCLAHLMQPAGADETARVIVIPARALLVPLPPPGLLSRFFVTLRVGSRFPQADDTGFWSAAGYRRVDLVSEPGELSRRGGILDLFPPTAEHPARIELEGDTIVSLRRFNPDDQRSIGTVDSYILAPARETVLGRPELDNLRTALERAGKPGPGRRRLLELLETQGGFAGIEVCARIIYPGAMSALEFIARGAAAEAPRLVCDEPDLVEEELRQQRADWLRAAEESGGEDYGLPSPADLLLSQPALTQQLRGAGLWLRQLAMEDEPESGPARPAIVLHASTMPSWRGRLPALMDFIRAELAAARTVCVLMKSDGRAHRITTLLSEHELASAELTPASRVAPEGGGLYVGTAAIGSGFSLPEAGLTVIAEQEIFGAEVAHRRPSVIQTFTSDFRDLNPGDLIVHVDHGLGLYEGLTRVASDGHEVDVMVLSYQGKDRLFVPATRLDLVQKYSGVGGKAPVLDKLGGTGWGRTKSRAKKAVQEMAVELLNLYAARKTITGHAFGPDTSWQHDFEEAFPWELTPHQLNALVDIKRDLESRGAMDRLLCGDVGFGKTEVALRAAFKVLMEGKQVALLAPTTVLVFQHANTITERFRSFPARIESLSRFRSAKDQKAVVAGLASGSVDFVVGTHRLLSKDVAFKDLGLLIVDEEQRFGVAAKERLKQLRCDVDVLTLTATPIPRTLQMSLMGVRDLSIIETPPENRLAIQTHLLAFKEPVIASAIRHELARQGQVYFVHNRVESAYAMAERLRALVPEARYGVAHGQMPEKDLEQTMLRFLRAEFDVLVSTTIIENGLDIPLVNTLIVNRADTFGLSQLYQMRGRIGRSDRQAYAYLLVPPETTLTEQARRRLKALQEFSDLGSGFRIAAMDLEIRGAGNLLGQAQHGHIAALGFELYCRMLEEAVAEQRSGAMPVAPLRASLNLAVDLKIPESYMADEHHRLMFYKRIASVTTQEELDRARDEMQDRYGKLPPQGLNLLELARLRLLAEKLRVQQVDYRAGALIVKLSEVSPIDPDHVLRYVRRRTDATFSPPAILRIKGTLSEAARLAATRELLMALA